MANKAYGPTIGAFLVLVFFSFQDSALAKSIYLYDNTSTVSSLVNDITVWRDPAIAAKASSRVFLNGSASLFKKVACTIKPGKRAQQISRSGNVVEVKVGFRCKGYVNARWVHNKR